MTTLGRARKRNRVFLSFPNLLTIIVTFISSRLVSSHLVSSHLVSSHLLLHSSYGGWSSGQSPGENKHQERNSSGDQECCLYYSTRDPEAEPGACTNSGPWLRAFSSKHIHLSLANHDFRSVALPISGIALTHHRSDHLFSLTCSIRDLFPDKCFEERGFSSSDKHVSYRDYASGKSQSQSRSVGKNRTLQRGHNENVDAFLDMLVSPIPCIIPTTCFLLTLH